MQNKRNLPKSVLVVMGVVVVVLTLWVPNSQSAMAAGPNVVCGEPENVKYDIRKTLNPSKTTFRLKGRVEELYYFHDRYSGVHVDPLAYFELKVVQHRDGTLEVLDGRRVPGCQANSAKM